MPKQKCQDCFYYDNSKLSKDARTINNGFCTKFIQVVNAHDKDCKMHLDLSKLPPLNDVFLVTQTKLIF